MQTNGTKYEKAGEERFCLIMFLKHLSKIKWFLNLRNVPKRPNIYKFFDKFEKDGSMIKWELLKKELKV